MKHLSRKIKSALAILFVCLIAFIGFSKAGIFFSDNGGDVITVSTTKKTFDPNNYVASMAKNNIINTTTAMPVTTTTKEVTTVTTTSAPTCNAWSGDKLTKNKGVVNGPLGKETYYNLDMNGVISAMRSLGYSEEDYPYWVREDGVKMLGQYVMIAANYSIYEKGTIDVPTSLGCAIVCDTGSFVKSNPTQIDIAVSWR